MRMNLRRAANVTLLVSLVLAPLAMGFASATHPPAASVQPALHVAPMMFMVPLATSTPDSFDPDRMVFIVPSMPSTPEIFAIAPDAGKTAASTSVQSQSTGPIETALHDENVASTRLGMSDVHSQIIAPTEAVLTDKDRTPTRLVIPAIRLDTTVEVVGWHSETRNGQPVNIWDVPDHFAAGWLKTSAPVGLPGNTVLDGHHNFLGKVFENLVDLELGDLITLYTASEKRVFRVEEKLILEEIGQPVEVRQANAMYIYPTADERLTLVTCWPPTGNSHRLIIIARPVTNANSRP